MLKRAFEWYRVVNVKPASQTINNRMAAVRSVMEAIDEGEDWGLALGCASGVVAGFDTNFMQDSPIVQLLISSIREHESAFPEDLSENALELRVCAAIALGEIMVRGNNEEPDVNARLIASVLRSGAGVRSAARGKYLKQLLDELDCTAAKVLTSGGLSRRERLATLARRLEKLQEPADLPTAWKSLIAALRATMKDVVQQSAIDREELNVLWWMFAGISNTTGQPIAEMPVGAAILCCGAELGNQCLVPPTSSLEAMVRRAFETGRKPQELTDRSLEKIASDWSGHLPKVLVPNEVDQNLAADYPTLFPISWLCNRILVSKGAASWASEFKHITGIQPNHICPPVNWAIQVFRERVAHRVYAESLGG